jgi:hypothetical protein
MMGSDDLIRIRHTERKTRPAAQAAIEAAFNAFSGELLSDHAEYRSLACRLLQVDELKPAPMPILTIYNLDDPPRPLIGDLEAEDDQRLAAVLGISPDAWEHLNEAKRLGRMKAAINLRQEGDAGTADLSRQSVGVKSWPL